ncbi:MAG: hypothetical protein ACP5MD_03030 [Verrucomicrobiia bacterium]
MRTFRAGRLCRSGCCAGSAVVSLTLWLASGYFLGLGVLGCILVQAGLFLLLWLWNILRDKRSD